MKLKRLIYSIIIIFIIFYKLNASEYKKFNRVWKNISGVNVKYEEILKNKINYVFYFKADDCLSCINNAFLMLKKLFPNITIIFGYYKKNELNYYNGVLLNKFKRNLYLLDYKYEFFLKLRNDKLTPFLLYVDNNRNILRIDDYLKIKKNFK